MASYLKELFGDSKADIETDITEDFFKLPSQMKNNPKYSVIIWIQGMTGSGKTTTAMMIGQKNLEDDTFICKFNIEDKNTGLMKELERGRHIAWYNVPNSLIENIQKAMIEGGYKKYAPLIRRITNFRDLLNNDILIIDEGILSANAKESLKIEFRNFEKGLSYTRHKRIIVIMNSTDDSVLVGFRKKAHIIVYKKLSDGYVNYQAKDDFIKKNRHVLTKLRVEEAIVLSNYKHLDKTGKIKINFEKIVPYYNDSISQNLSDQSFDSDYDQEKRIDNLITHYAEKVRQFFQKDLFKQKKIDSIIIDWLKLNFPDQYYDLKRNIKDIIKRAMHFQYLIDREEKEKKKESEEERIKNMSDFDPKEIETMQNLENYSERDKRIGVFLLQGRTQDWIAKKEKFANNTRVCQIKKDIFGALANKIGKDYEYWFYIKKKEEFAYDPEIEVFYTKENRSKPDLIIKKKDEWIIVYSLKTTSVYRNKREYYPTDHDPEIKYCNEMHEKHPEMNIECIFHHFHLTERVYVEKPIDYLNLPEKWIVNDNIEINACY